MRLGRLICLTIRERSRRKRIRARVSWFGITVAQPVAQARRFRVAGAAQPASNAITHTIGTQNNSDKAIQSTIGRNVCGTYRSG